MKKMTNLYAKAMETPVKKYRIAPMKALFTLIVLLFVSSNAWGATLYGKTAVGAGKGTATVEIYNGYNMRQDAIRGDIVNLLRQQQMDIRLKRGIQIVNVQMEELQKVLIRQRLVKMKDVQICTMRNLFLLQ